MNANEGKRFQELQTEVTKLRAENRRLKDAGNPEKLKKFRKETERAVLFAAKGIEDRTMNMVNENLAKTFNLVPDSLIIRGFRDCLRLATHMIDPRRAANLYNALRLDNPNKTGAIPTIEEVEAIVAANTKPPLSQAMYLNPGIIPEGPERDLYITLRALGQKVENEDLDTVEEIRATVQAATLCMQHPAAILTYELAEAVDHGAEDIGGSRPQKTILAEALDAFLPTPSQELLRKEQASAHV